MLDIAEGLTNMTSRRLPENPARIETCSRDFSKIAGPERLQGLERLGPLPIRSTWQLQLWLASASLASNRYFHLEVMASEAQSTESFPSQVLRLPACNYRRPGSGRNRANASGLACRSIMTNCPYLYFGRQRPRGVLVASVWGGWVQ
jgi:hypothetical protein